MYCIKVTVFVLGALAFTCLYSCVQPKAASQTTQAESGGYRLVWADEFNTDGALDTASWNFEQGFVRNQELQWYQRENAFCKNGLLIIEGRRDRKPNPVYIAGSADWKKNRDSIQYTSSSINTARKHTWQYGRFIMRGKIDISEGLWPAWWTLGATGKWPANGEIDIMEYYRNKILANIACIGADNKAEWFSETKPADSLGGCRMGIPLSRVADGLG